MERGDPKYDCRRVRIVLSRYVRHPSGRNGFDAPVRRTSGWRSVIGGSLAGHWPRSTLERGQAILLASLVVLTLGAWTLTIYQAQTMDMPMGIAVRGGIGSQELPAGDGAMESNSGMAMDDPGADSVDALASASMAGMSGMGWTWRALAAFVVAWAAMMTAMMFPSVAPMLLLFQTMATRRKATGAAHVPTWIFALGYLAVWTAIGVAAWVLIQVGSDLVSWMSVTGRETWAPLALGTVLVVAGLYQFTPLKNACLRQCQSPIGFVMSHWRDGPQGALRMGFVHGAYCLGCCWALFAVLVATGVMSLAWMLLLTLVVTAEKLLPAGPRVPQAIGVAFLAVGIWVATGAGDVPWTA